MELNHKTVKPKVNISELFQESKLNGTYVKICAPMVRYSKLQFRNLIRKYGVDLTYTPMIMADSFFQSNKARLNEFTTNYDDSPVIAQFAAKESLDFLYASEMIYPYVDGVDLNSGCPQRWAMSDGYGSALLNNPQIIKDIILHIRRNLPSDFSISIKMRLLPKSLESTIDLCRQLEKCGPTYLTMHGRTCHQKSSEPADKVAIREIKKSLQVPLIANGDIMSLDDADSTYQMTNCDGMMAARGMLENPALFAGFRETPLSCVQDWIDICHKAGDDIQFQCFHHHLTFMMEKIMKKADRITFNSLTKKYEVYDFMRNNYNIVPIDTITNARDDDDSLSLSYSRKIDCVYDDSKYKKHVNVEIDDDIFNDDALSIFQIDD